MSANAARAVIVALAVAVAAYAFYGLTWLLHVRACQTPVCICPPENPPPHGVRGPQS